MKIRLFIQNIDPNNIKIIDDQHHYLANVLRIKNDDEVFIFNEQGEWQCRVAIVHKKYIMLQIQKQIEKNDKLLDITVCIPLIKPDTMSRMIRQSVEIGVKKIIIFNARYSSVRHINLDKIRVIAIEALEQCGGILLPKIIFCDNLQEAFIECEGIILYANEKTIQNGEKNKIPKNIETSMFIGPEGGFSDEEINFLSNQKDAISVNLGHRILRSDTALISLINKVF